MYRLFDSGKRVCLSVLTEGAMKGEISVIFDSDPVYSIEVMSYSTIGHITKENFNEINY